MLSAVNLGPMIIGSVACGTDSAVLLAALDNRAADPAVPRVELAGARLVRVVAVAAVIVLIERSGEHVVCSLESGELGSPVFELDAELSKSASCSRSSVIHDAP